MTVYGNGSAPPLEREKGPAAGRAAVEPGAEPVSDAGAPDDHSDGDSATAAAREAAGLAAEQFKAAAAALAEIKAYAAQWASATASSYVALARNLVLLAALGAILAVAGVAAVATAAVLATVGLAELLSREVFHGRTWAGNLVVGVGLLLLIVGGGYLTITLLSGGSKRKAAKAYQTRLDRQRDAHKGWDAERRAE